MTYETTGSSGTMWRCPNCLQYFENGHYHNCTIQTETFKSPNIPYHMPFELNPERILLTEIKELLVKILKVLESE